MPLTLYRRHKKACTQHYPQDYRTFKPRTARETKADCECPIVVSGSLRLESKRIKHLSTETSRWDKALATAAQWEEWEALTDPNPVAQEENITFDNAALRYLEFKGPKGDNIEKSTLRKHQVMLKDRIAQYCLVNNIQFLKAFDVAATVTDCFLSFKNLNPHRNRKNQAAIEKPLGDGTKRAELERYRSFLRFCMEQGWLTHNHAAKIKLGKITPSPKYGLEPSELAQVFDAIELVTNRRALDQYNSKELRAIVLVMVYSGLRISDAVTLNDTQLVRRESGSGFAIKLMSMQKTGEWVRIPVTQEVADALHSLSFKGEKDGKKFWFYSGNGERDTAINNWRERVTNLLTLAQEPPLYKPFAHHASPHSLRHTFAISMLNQGIDIHQVSRWLGHSSIRVTEAHYAHANRQTHIASEIAYDLGIQRQQSAARQSQ